MEGAHEHERDENLCPQDTPARLQAPHAKQASGDCEQTPPVRPLQLHNAATVRQALTIQETTFPFAPEQLQVFQRPALRVFLFTCACLTFVAMACSHGSRQACRLGSQAQHPA